MNMIFKNININDDLRLVQLQPDQANTLFELTDSNRQYLGEFLAWVSYVKEVEDSRKHIEETLRNRKRNTTYTYGIEYDGKIVGDISIRNMKDTACHPRSAIG
jgi:ribosomal-protein-serine acetyltransferase